MTQTYRHRHFVQFHETDMAGIVHFSNFFRYMEEAEVAFLRSRGLHVSWNLQNSRFGFPRVSATCDFFKPVRFEDEIEDLITVDQVGTKSVTYTHEFTCNGELLAKGRITAVFVQVDAEHGMKSAEIPADVRAKLLGESDAP